MSKKIWIDLETTGIDAKLCGITEIGFIVEIDGKVVNQDSFEIDPRTYRREIYISDEALKIQNRDDGQFLGSGNSDRVLEIFLSVIGRYIDKFDKDDRYTICGYNVNFDIAFLKEWFVDCGYEHYDSWFTYKEVDVFALVKILKDMKLYESDSDSLLATCGVFEIPITAHEALSDIVATKSLYDILRNKYIRGINNGNESI